jgi:hypothetical protein
MTGATAGPGANNAGGAAALMSVSPAGHSVGVSVTSPLTMRFNQGMAAGMEQFVDLHLGDPSGPTLPLHYGWSSDRTVLTCFPDEPLHAHTRYALHMGDGMTDEGGHGVNLDEHGGAMGGDWLFASMMSGHGGMPWSMMGADWHGPNGSYGMFFSFTTE